MISLTNYHLWLSVVGLGRDNFPPFCTRSEPGLGGLGASDAKHHRLEDLGTVVDFVQERLGNTVGPRS